MPRIIITITVVLFLAAIAGGFFLWWPEYQEFTALRRELDNKEKALEAKIAYFKELKEASRKIEEYTEEFEKVSSALPDSPLEPAILRFVETTASENGLLVEKLGGVKTSQSKGFKTIAFSGGFSGSYSSLKNFILAVYQNSRIVEIETISFGTKEENSLFNFEIGFKTHAFSEGAGTGSLKEGAFPAPELIK